jgi:tetratricopeptide (TPR) repeat protein
MQREFLNRDIDYMNQTEMLPKTAQDWNQQGCNLCEQGNLVLALAAFDQAISLQADYATAWNNRGNTLCGLYRYAEATAAYEKAIALKPQYHQAWFNRGKLMAELGAYGNAVEAYSQAIGIKADPLYIHALEDIWVKQKLVPYVS